MPNLAQTTAELETEIDELADEAERCRRIALGAKAAIVGGILLLLASLGRAGPAAILFGIAAVLGGTALAGSNRSTLGAIKARIHAHEARRAEMIHALGPTSPCVDDHSHGPRRPFTG